MNNQTNQNNIAQTNTGELQTNETKNEPQRKHSLFDDPALSQNIQEDPFVRFILLRRNAIFTFFLIIAAAFYLKNQIQETTLARVMESSQVFEQARFAFDSLSDKSKQLPEEERKKLQISLTDSLLNLKTGAEPYAGLSLLYSVLSSNQTESLSDDWAKSQDWNAEQDSAERLVRELQTLVVIRKNLDKDPSAIEAYSMLKRLIKDGRYADLSAFFLLARTAEQPEDKQYLKDVSAEIKGRYAEQADKIEQALSAL